MSKRNYIQLSEPDIQEIEKFLHPSMAYDKDAVVFHKGHIPHVGFLLLEGEMFLEKNKKKFNFSRGALVGVEELYGSLSLDGDLKVTSGTKVCVFDRSALKQILNDNSTNEHLFSLLQSVLESQTA